VAADLHKLAVGREHYYTREIARNREEYRSGHGESPGIYHGGSARALGLEGECPAEAFKRLFSWQDPRTGQQLGRGPRQDAMPAWDLVLRPHKDVSVLYALGDEATGRQVAAAHQAGVRATVAYLDRQVGTRTGRHGAEHGGAPACVGACRPSEVVGVGQCWDGGGRGVGRMPKVGQPEQGLH
jgi:hypothetical protein